MGKGNLGWSLGATSRKSFVPGPRLYEQVSLIGPLVPGLPTARPYCVAMPAQRTGAPLYEQARQYVIDLIASGDYGPGARLPSESALAEEFGVHRLTARRALEELVREGIVVARKGSGTYVSPLRQQLPISVPLTRDGFAPSLRRQLEAAGPRLPRGVPRDHPRRPRGVRAAGPSRPGPGEPGPQRAVGRRRLLGLLEVVVHPVAGEGGEADVALLRRPVRRDLGPGRRAPLAVAVVHRPSRPPRTWPRSSTSVQGPPSSCAKA